MAGVRWIIAWLGLSVASGCGAAAAPPQELNGLWSAGVSWGLLLTRRAQTIASGAAVVLGIGLFLAWVDLTAQLTSGARVLPFGASAPDASAPAAGDVCREASPVAPSASRALPGAPR